MVMYIFSYILISIISYKIFKTITGSVSLFEFGFLPWLYFGQLLVMSYTGVMLLNAGIPYFLKFSNSSVIAAFWAVSYCMIAIPLTIKILDKISKNSIAINSLHFQRIGTQVKMTENDRVMHLFWRIIFVISCCGTVYVYAQNGWKTPFFLSLTSDTSVALLNEMRYTAKYDFSGILYIRNLIALLLGPLVSLIFYAYYRQFNSITVKIWYWLSLINTVLIVTYSGEKAPLVFYILSIIIVEVCVKGRLSKWRTIKYSIIVLVLIIGTFFKLTKNTEIYINGGIVGRILFAQIAGVPATFELFPKVYGFLNGGMFPEWITEVIGVEPASHKLLLKSHYDPVGVSTRSTGVMNTLFIGEAYANFGILGAVFSPIIISVIIFIILNMLFKKKTPTSIGIYAWFSLHIGLSGGFVNFLYNPKWFMIIIILVSSIIFKGAIRPKIQNK
jgi:oligosaccharide repeat unit polymerase